MKREANLNKPFSLCNAIEELLLLQRKNGVHVIDAHDDLRFANHALQSLNGIRCCHDGELTILQVDEFDFISWSQAKSSPYLDRDGDLAFRIQSGSSHEGTYAIGHLNDSRAVR